MKCLYALAILAVFLVFLRFHVGEGFGVNGFSSEGFEEPISVVICKAEWCGHCKKAAPEFKRLVDASPIQLQNGKQAVVSMIDADADKDKLSMYKVRGFPTILIGNDMKEYPGDRTYNGVVEYLNHM